MGIDDDVITNEGDERVSTDGDGNTVVIIRVRGASPGSTSAVRADELILMQRSAPEMSYA